MTSTLTNLITFTKYRTEFLKNAGCSLQQHFFAAHRIGGLLPIVFSYCSEFLCQADRSKYLSWLLIFWELGGLLVSFIAWAMLPMKGIRVVDVHSLSSTFYKEPQYCAPSLKRASIGHTEKICLSVIALSLIHNNEVSLVFISSFYKILGFHL